MGIVISSTAKSNSSLFKEYLIRNLNDTKNELMCAYDTFNNLTDDMLIEAYIFEINSLRLKYDYYMKQLKLCKHENDEAVPLTK